MHGLLTSALYGREDENMTEWGFIRCCLRVEVVRRMIGDDKLLREIEHSRERERQREVKRGK